MNIAPRKILVRGVNWLGDAVMTTPALFRLREAFPEAQITLATPEKLRDLWVNHPGIDQVESIAKGESIWELGRRWRPQQFDLGLVFPNSHRSALELWAARIPARVGYRKPWRNWFLTQAIPQRPEYVAMHKRSEMEVRKLVEGRQPAKRYPISAHHIFQYLNLIKALGGSGEPIAPQIVVLDAAKHAFQEKYRIISDSQEKSFWCGLNAGAEYGPAKRWPAERFIETAIELQKRWKCRWMVFGIAADRALNAKITEAINEAGRKVFSRDECDGMAPALDLTGVTTLGELAAAMKCCKLVLTNDSGPMHLSAAVGTAVVVPFGSTSPELTGPSLPGEMGNEILRVDAPCAPCFLRECPIDFRCMRGISVEMAILAGEEIVHKRLK